MRRSFALGGSAVIALMLVITAWLAVVPNLAVSGLRDRVQLQLSRRLEVKGGAHLSFAPLAFTLNQVSLALPEGMEGRFITAEKLRIPVGLAQLFGGTPVFTTLTLEGADIALLVDERDRVSWDFGGSAPATPLTFHLASSAIRYYDARNGQALAIGDVNGGISIGSDGLVSFTGSTDLNGRLARFDMTLKSLARVSSDGSPFTLSFATPEITANFDGRLSVAKVLNLDGPVDIAITNLRQAARRAGLAIKDGTSSGAVSITGALGSSGRAFAIRQANVGLDQANVYGEIAIDTRHAVPKLQARLTTPNFTLDSFLPPSGASDGAWGRLPLGFAVLKQFDAEITLETPDLRYGPLNNQPARLVATVAGGKFQASVALQPADGAIMSADVAIDASAVVPVFSANVKTESADARLLLSTLLGQDWLSGKGSLAANLSGSGQTQEEIIGSLKGKATLSLSNGAIAGLDVAAGLGQVSFRILDGWPGDRASRTEFTSLTADVTVADGIATIGNLKLDGKGLALAATGEIDLLRRAADLSADPRLIGADGSSAGLPVKIVVNGPWAAPRIYPDVEGLPGDPQKGFAALKSMGVKSGN